MRLLGETLWVGRKLAAGPPPWELEQRDEQHHETGSKRHGEQNKHNGASPCQWGGGTFPRVAMMRQGAVASLVSGMSSFWSTSSAIISYRRR